MQTVQIRLTAHQVDELDKLVKKGTFPNRSEAIRHTIEAVLLKGRR